MQACQIMLLSGRSSFSKENCKKDKMPIFLKNSIIYAKMHFDKYINIQHLSAKSIHVQLY
jgi:hypothetical protein